MITSRYDIEFIRHEAIKLLTDHGVPDEQAYILTDSMLEADKSGVATHGIRMLPAYIRKLDNGDFSFEDIVVKKSFPAFSVVNSNNCIGAVSAYYCTQLAINEAKNNGMHTVFAYNSNTLGPAFYYVKKIAEKGLIGYVCCNSPAAMPANNGLEVMLGTNPFAFACPSKSAGTILIDMATSAVAKSKFLEAKNKGQKLSMGLALDSLGNPTVNPDEAIRGLVLPMAGVKGYGIAIMIDVLSGVLSGAAYLNNVGKFYSNDGHGMNVGHMFVAIDPSAIYDGDFFAEMDQYIKTLRNSKVKKGQTITLPGDGKREKENAANEYGIELPEDIVKILSNLFKISDLKPVN